MISHFGWKCKRHGHNPNLCFKEIILNIDMQKTNWKLKGWKEGDEEISFCSVSRRANSGFANSCDDNRDMSLRNFVEEPLHLLIDMTREEM